MVQQIVAFQLVWIEVIWAKSGVSLAGAYSGKVSDWLLAPGGAFRSARSATELGWQIGEEAGPESAPRQSLTTISARHGRNEMSRSMPRAGSFTASIQPGVQPGHYCNKPKFP